MPGFCSLKGAQLGQCYTPDSHPGGHTPWLWVQGRDGTSCMQRGFGMNTWVQRVPQPYVPWGSR